MTVSELMNRVRRRKEESFRRVRILLLLLGGGILLSGFAGWLFLLPALLLCGIAFRLLRPAAFPCPHCRKEVLTEEFEALLLCCPHCGTPLAEDPLPPAEGYHFPDWIRLPPAARRTAEKYARPDETFPIQCIVLAGIFLTAGILMILFHFPSQERIFFPFLRIFGSVLLFFGIFLPQMRLLLLRFRRKVPGTVLPACPVCGGIPLPQKVLLTGRCSCCCAALKNGLFPPEGDRIPSQDLREWRIHRKLREEVTGVYCLLAAPVVCFVLYRTGIRSIHWILVLLFSVLIPQLYLNAFLPYRAKKRRLAFRCPECGHDCEPFSELQETIRFRRCPACLRRILPDGETHS